MVIITQIVLGMIGIKGNRMMRVYAISDLHGNLPHVPECELLLLGGDYPGSDDIKFQRRFIEEDFGPWLKKLPCKYKVGIAGNHDFLFQAEPAAIEKLDWIYLRDEGVEIEGVKIYGTPWTHAYGDWAYQEPEERLEHWFNKIPRGLDILLTHGPMYHILDKNQEGVHCGSKNLRDIVDEVIPDSVVCGHIHEGRGIEQFGSVRVYNVTYVDRNNSPKYNCANVPLKA